jgi:replicative DNA helicase
LQQDDPDKGRHAATLVRHEDFSHEENRLTFQMLSDVLSTVESPKAADCNRHELWVRCRETYIDCMEMASKQRCAYRISIERFARQVRENAVRRRVTWAVKDLEGVTASRDCSSAALVQAAEAVKAAALAVQTGDVPTTLSDAISEYLVNEETPKVRSGFGPVDRITGGGLPVGGLSVFAAPPSVGKSALALQLCLGAMDSDDSLHVVWGMGEMTLDAFARRAVCHWSTRRDCRNVSMSVAERRTEDARGTAIAMADMIGKRMTLVKPPLAISKLEDAVVESGSRLLVIDYIQLVEMEAADRRAEIDGIVKRVRRLSLERDVSIVAISNIAKGVGSDTRIGAIGKESSELDFAADLFLLGDPDEHRDENGGRMVRWMCKKNRHGPCEDILTRFDGQLQTFYYAQATPVADFSSEW